MLLSQSLALEWNDNVYYSDLRRQEDFILRPTFNLNALRPIGQANVVRFSFGLGYEKYLQHEEYDRLVVEPGSELSFDLLVKNVRINFHNKLSYENDPGREASVAQTGKYGGLQNSAGVAATWDLQDIVLTAGYDYSTFLSSSQRYAYLDRESHQFLARAGLAVHPTTTVGLEATAGPTQFDQPYLNDNFAVSVGAYSDWRPGQYIRLQPRAGYARYSFSETRFFGKAPAQDAFYFGVNLSHRISQSVTYSLDGGREMRQGVNANLLSEWKASAFLSWRLIRDVYWDAGLSYVNGQEMVWFAQEQFDQAAVRLGTAYQLMEKLRVRLGYSHTLRDSNTIGRRYSQNRLTLSFTYSF